MYRTVFSAGGDDFLVDRNGNYSGDVIISVASDRVQPSQFDPDQRQISLPFDLLKGLVADWKRGDLTRSLEDTSDDEILKDW